MRRIDAIAIAFGVFIAGGAAYLLLQVFGLSAQNAGVWSQALLMAGLIGWVSTYLVRFFTQNMTYHQQLRDHQEAVIQKRLEEMTPEELAELQEEVEKEKAAEASSTQQTEENQQQQ